MKNTEKVPAGVFRTIREVHDAFDQGKITPEAYIRGYLDRAKATKDRVFITLCEAQSVQAAQKAAEIIKKNGGKVPRKEFPLLAIPIGIKDILTTDGVLTTCASKMLANYIPPYTATAVERLEKAGAISIGKTNLDEFAMGGSNENSAYGAVHHPTHPDRVPGGSSGGSAAAVKAHLCHASLGTDTGGSIRQPASYCGLVGLKPTYGRISRYGQIAFGSSLDQIGPLTHSVEDAALLMDVMSGHDPLDSTSASLEPSKSYSALKTPFSWKGVKVGVPKEFFVKGLAPEVEKSVQDALKSLEEKGAELVPISLPHTSYAVSVYYIVAVSEASSNLARFDGVRFGVRPKEVSEAKDLNDFYKKVRSGFGSEVKRRIILGTFALSSGYSDAYFKRACQVRRQIKNDFDQAFKSVDLILGPVAPTTAFKLGAMANDPLQMYLQDIFTIPANLAGLPAISVPCGRDKEGLPIGLHLMAPQLAEDQLLSAALSAEEFSHESF